MWSFDDKCINEVRCTLTIHFLFINEVFKGSLNYKERLLNEKVLYLFV